MGRSPHLPRFGRETERDLAIVERAMDLANVSHIADRPITEISGGERQRAFIAMCLAQEPQVLLLDEPTSHLDIGHQLSILNLIRNLNRQTRMTVVAVFHDLNLAAEYCDRLVLLDRGRVVAAGTPADVLTTEMILNVYGVKVLIERNPVSDGPHIVLAANRVSGVEHKSAIPATIDEPRDERGVLVAVATLVELKDRLVLGETVAALSWLTYARIRRPPGQRDICPQQLREVALVLDGLLHRGGQFRVAQKHSPNIFRGV